MRLHDDPYPPLEASLWWISEEEEDPYPPLEEQEPLLTKSFDQLRRELGDDVSRLLSGQ